jgi:hypothetical protein
LKQTQIGFLHLANRLQFGTADQINPLQTQPLINPLLKLLNKASLINLIDMFTDPAAKRIINFQATP